MTRLSEDRLDALLALADRAAATALTGAYEPVGGALRDAADELDPAIRQRLAAGRLSDAMAMISGLQTYWVDSGRAREGQALAEQALRAPRDGREPIDPALIARTMLTASETAFRQGDQAAAAAWATASVDAAATTDPVTAALAEVSLARVAFRDGDAARIESLSRGALDRAGEAPKVQRAAFHMLAWAAYTAGDRDGALKWFERSLAVRRAMADPFGIAVELGNLGEMAMEAGDLPRAAASLEDALTIALRLENLYLLTSLIGSAGALAVAAGDAEDGLTLLAAADAAYASTSLVPDPSTQEMLDAAVAKARSAVIPERAEAAEARGRSLTVNEAAARATSVCRGAGSTVRTGGE